MNKSNELHSQMKKIIMSEKDRVLHSIGLYYDSLITEIDSNYHRKQTWLKEISDHYNNVRN